MIILTEIQIKEELGGSIYQKGLSYQQNGQVLSLQVSTEGSYVAGTVQGSRKTPYKVDVQVIVKKGPPIFVFINGACSCPMKFNCKHVAAVLIEAQKRYAAYTEVQPSETPQDINALLKAVTLNPEHAKNSDFDKWARTINVDADSDTQSIKAPTEYQLLYILKNHAYKIGVLVIELVVAKPLKKGGFGNAYKSFSYTADTHFRALKPVDFDILHRLEVAKRMISSYSHSLYQYEYELKTDPTPSILQNILVTGRCYWSKHQETEPLQLGTPTNGDFEWQMAEDGKQKLICKINHKKISILPLLPPWYLDIDNKRCGRLESNLDPKVIQTLMTSPPLVPQDVPKITTVLKERFKQIPNIPLPRQFESMEIKTLIPKPKLTIFGTHSEHLDLYRAFRKSCVIPLGRVSFFYDGIEVSIANPETVESVDPKTHQLRILTRNLPTEAEWIKNLIDQHQVDFFSERYPNLFIHNAKPLDLLVAPIENQTEQENFLSQTVPALKQSGWEIMIDPSFPVQLVIAVDDWYTEVHETNEFDWFNMEVGFVLEGQKVNILPLLVRLIEQNSEALSEKYLNSITSDSLKLNLPSGQTIAVPLARIKGILATLTELYDNKSLDKSGFLAISRLRAAQLLELEKAMSATKMRWLGGERLRQLSEKLSDFTGIEQVAIPTQFKGQLRDYQKVGVNWLNFLREFRLGGILSDDMGLGKTIQTLAHLLIEKESGRLNKPCLIVAPTSLMENWRSESEKFSPSLKVLVLQGQDRKGFFYGIKKSDIILTTYPLIVRDKDILLEHEYYMVILDEAQFIKNANTKAYAILQQIKTDHRLCLTGTPMENHLGELWSLFNFLSPGLLGESKQFTHIFRTPIEKHGNAGRRQSLAQRLKPYLLRRTKEEVVLELPNKTEIIHKIVLEEEQRDLYESIRLTMESKVQKAIQSKGFASSQIVILDALLKLRQTCCDPRLLKLEQAKKVQKSAKLAFLMDMLAELIDENKKILLFSSFTSMLALIEQALLEQNMSYVKLTGATTDRKTPIQQFQSGKVSIFLISLKAGGTGLNLTAADTVIHYDPWWNPAAETQATDRAHRIGQTKPVFVYKLVTTGTVEEKILKMQDKKRALLQGVFDESQDAKAGKISANDLKYLFQGIDDLEHV